MSWLCPGKEDMRGVLDGEWKQFPGRGNTLCLIFEAGRSMACCRSRRKTKRLELQGPSRGQWLPPGSGGKESACSAGDLGSVSGLGRSPGEGMATLSSILTWRSPWTEEPGGLQSMGLQRVTHD